MYKDAQVIIPDVNVLIDRHDDLIYKYGGHLGVRDMNALMSALDRPLKLIDYDGVRKDLFDVAASIAFGIIRNHPFVDGNKRASWLAMRTFLMDNGVKVKIRKSVVQSKVLDLANKVIEQDEFAEWLRSSKWKPAKISGGLNFQNVLRVKALLLLRLMTFWK